MSTIKISDEQLRSHPVVSREQWNQARRELLRQEKEVTRLNDELSSARRALPWVQLEKDYVFTGPDGKKTLGELFDGRSQLLIYHFMLAPDWEQGCKGCSFLADHFDGANQHLAHHDVTLVAVSRAPWRQIAPFKQRMGWHFDWYSSDGSDFNQDFHVSAAADEIASGKREYNFETVDYMDEMPGISAFYRDAEGRIFHTYSTYARGLDVLLGTHHFLDLTAKGRDEAQTMDWVRHHDRYDEQPKSGSSCCQS